MAVIIDRRKNAKDRTLKNRRRFIDLHKRQIAESVKNIMDQKKLSDINSGKNDIIVRPTSEPTFRVNPKTGNREYVLPGNDRFVKDEKITKPPQREGTGSGQEGSLDGEGTDSFVFELTEDEFMDFVFDQLELPDMVKKQLKDTKAFDPVRAGHRSKGTPSQMDLIKSARNALGRRIGLGRPSLEKMESLYLELEREVSEIKKAELQAHIDELEKKRSIVPWLDPFDVKYRNYTLQPKPRTKAVMLCCMDVSFSMTRDLKLLAKSFFMLLNLFLKRKYEKVDIIFIKHHSEAFETDEQDFFYSDDTGGTAVSTAFVVANKIIAERYPLDEWNIYCAQASDGDNAYQDMNAMRAELHKLLAKSQYFAYIETTSADRVADHHYGYYNQHTLWNEYAPIAAVNPVLNMKRVIDEKDVWKVFAELFHKDAKYAAR